MILVIKELKACFFSYDNTGHNRVTVDSHQKYLLPRVEIENYNIEIDGRNFYDQLIIDLIRNTMMSEKYLFSACPLIKVAVPFAKKYFRSIRNYSCCFSN